MRISLREVPQQLFCFEINIFAQQAEVIAALKQIFEHVACLFALAYIP